MFEVGDVLYVYNTAVTPPEHKYSVFVCNLLQVNHFIRNLLQANFLA